jgi:3-deoxy-manno-octulosonate cytidylyltransferase (CMP-KDO synthetase)
MIVRVWERAAMARVDRVVVATDDDRIADAARAAGAEVVLTGACATGTDRVAEAARRLRDEGLRPTVVVNVQGDEPLLDPAAVDAVADRVRQGAPIATGAARLHGEVEAHLSEARVKVVTDDAGRALYFSRLPIPLGGPWWQHVGLYAFAPAALDRVAALPPHALEASERLEQLRWLAAGEAIAVVPLAAPHPSVDTPADLDLVRRLWADARPPYR